MILVSEVEAIRDTRSHNTRRIRAKHKNVTAEMKTKTENQNGLSSTVECVIIAIFAVPLVAPAFLAPTFNGGPL